MMFTNRLNNYYVFKLIAAATKSYHDLFGWRRHVIVAQRATVEQVVECPVFKDFQAYMQQSCRGPLVSQHSLKLCCQCLYNTSTRPPLILNRSILW